MAGRIFEAAEREYERKRAGLGVGRVEPATQERVFLGVQRRSRVQPRSSLIAISGVLVAAAVPLGEESQLGGEPLEARDA
jgi:hypothetical protein